MEQRFVNKNPSVGSDSNNGRTTSSPLLTIQRAVNLSSPGDKISSFGGLKYFEEVTTNKSGLSFDSYGNSQKAEWTGFLPLSGWVNLGGGKWEVTASSLLSTVKQVRLDGSQQEKGRFPRRSDPRDGTLPISNAGVGTVTNSSVSGMGLVGAEVVIRTSQWTYDVGQITSHSGGTLNFTGQMSYTPQNGFGFFVQNHITLLTQTGDWMYNPSTKKITMFFEGSDNPNNYTIEASAKDTLFNMTWGPQEFSFENIVFSGSNGHACRLYGGTVFNFNNVDFKNIGANAINSDNSTYVDVDGCNFEWCNNAGVFLKNETYNGRVRNSNFYKIGTLQGAYQSGAVGQGYGIQLTYAGSEASNNVLDQIGYIGIRFGGDNTKVLRNHVKNFCSEMTDGSAIYARGYSNTSPDWVNVEVKNNIIEDSLGTGGGTPFSGQQEGIYLDDWCAGVTIENNYVARVNGKALFMHNNRNIKWLNNTVFDCTYGFYSQTDGLSNPRTRGIVFKGNKIVSARNQPQYMVRLESPYSDDLHLFSASTDDFNDNVYYSLSGLTGTSFVYQSGAGNNHKSFALWKDAYGYDADSEFYPITLADVVKFRNEINPNNAPRIISFSDGQYSDLSGNTLAGSFTQDSYTGNVFIKTSDVPVEPTDPIPYTITLNDAEGGSAAIITEGPYYQGMTIQVQSTQATGYTFKHWLLELSPGTIGTILQPTLSFTMPGNDVTITPVFEGEPEPVTYITFRGKIQLV